MKDCKNTDKLCFRYPYLLIGVDFYSQGAVGIQGEIAQFFFYSLSVHAHTKWGGIHVPQHVCVSQKTTHKHLFFLSTMWVPGFELINQVYRFDGKHPYPLSYFTGLVSIFSTLLLLSVPLFLLPVMITFAIGQRETLLSEYRLPVEAVSGRRGGIFTTLSMCDSFFLYSPSL